MPTRVVLGREIQDAPRRTIAGADCWLTEDLRWIVAARQPVKDRLYRWKAEEEPKNG